LPKKPTAIAPNRHATIHVMPMRRAFGIERRPSAAMKRARMCGCPKYPRPHASSEMMPTAPSAPPLNGSSLAGSTERISARLSWRPPVLWITTIGVSTSAKIISEACTVSVQLTARKPPISV
jgi:hypothetical protein